MSRDATYLGTVQDVQGATISVALDTDTVSGLVFLEGHGYRIGQIGSFLRIPMGFTDLFGVVSHVGAGAVPDVLADVEPYGHRWLKVQLIGEGARAGEFLRGISQYPTIGDEVHLVTDGDLSRIYGQAKPNSVRVGTLASAESIQSLVDVDKLVSRHSAVVGATGAGKSTTVAGILASLSDPGRYPSARIIVLDVHGEYYNALRDRATVFRVNPSSFQNESPLFVPYWALNFDELVRMTPFRGVGDADRSGLIEKVKELKLESLAAKPRKGVTADTVTVDTPIPFSIHRLWYDLYRLVCSTHTAQGVNQSEDTEAIEENSSGQKQMGDVMNVIPPYYKPITSGGKPRVYLSGSQLNIRRQVLALQSLLRDTRYDFLFRPGPWSPGADGKPDKDIDDLLRSWIGGKHPITILDLSGVPVSILMDLVGVLMRLLFDALFWSRLFPEGGRKRPLLFVLEEAHLYLNAGNENAASVAARRLVKEGRKYGLGAMIVSQRPSEIDSTILSQCGTLFAMRLANRSDRSQVTGTVSDNLDGLFDMLPSLRTGEAIIVGEAVQMPLRTLIDPPAQNRKPDSDDPLIFDPQNERGWNQPKRDEDYGEVVRAWRSERPGSDKSKERA